MTSGLFPLRSSGDVLGHTMYIKTSFRTNARNVNPGDHMENLSIKESAK